LIGLTQKSGSEHSAQSNSKRVNYKERSTKIRYCDATLIANIVAVAPTFNSGLISIIKIAVNQYALIDGAIIYSVNASDTLQDYH